MEYSLIITRMIYLRYDGIFLIHQLLDVFILQFCLELLHHAVVAFLNTGLQHHIPRDDIRFMLIPVFRERALGTAVAFRAANERPGAFAGYFAASFTVGIMVFRPEFP